MGDLQPGVPCPRPLDGSGPAVRGAVVDDPEHARGLPVGDRGRDLLDQATEGRDPGLGLTASDNVGPVHVEDCDVTAPSVFVFYPHCATGAGRHGGMGTVTRVDARLLVGRNDKLVVAERLARPAPLMQVERGCGLLSELAVVAGRDCVDRWIRLVDGQMGWAHDRGPHGRGGSRPAAGATRQRSGRGRHRRSDGGPGVESLEDRRSGPHRRRGVAGLSDVLSSTSVSSAERSPRSVASPPGRGTA